MFACALAVLQLVRGGTRPQATSADVPLAITYTPQHEPAARELRRYLHLLDDFDADLALLSPLETTAALRLHGGSNVVLAGPRATDAAAHALLEAALPAGTWVDLGAGAGADDHVLHTYSPHLTICHGASVLATKCATHQHPRRNNMA